MAAGGGWNRRYVAHANLEAVEAPAPVRCPEARLHGLEGFDPATGAARLSQVLLKRKHWYSTTHFVLILFLTGHPPPLPPYSFSQRLRFMYRDDFCCEPHPGPHERLGGATGNGESEDQAGEAAWFESLGCRVEAVEDALHAGLAAFRAATTTTSAAAGGGGGGGGPPRTVDDVALLLARSGDAAEAAALEQALRLAFAACDASAGGGAAASDPAASGGLRRGAREARRCMAAGAAAEARRDWSTAASHFAAADAAYAGAHASSQPGGGAAGSGGGGGGWSEARSRQASALHLLGRHGDAAALAAAALALEGGHPGARSTRALCADALVALPPGDADGLFFPSGGGGGGGGVGGYGGGCSGSGDPEEGIIVAGSVTGGDGMGGGGSGSDLSGGGSGSGFGSGAAATGSPGGGGGGGGGGLGEPDIPLGSPLGTVLALRSALEASPWAPELPQRYARACLVLASLALATRDQAPARAAVAAAAAADGPASWSWASDAAAAAIEEAATAAPGGETGGVAPGRAPGGDFFKK